MKTTVELPDALLIEAKKRAAETRTTLRELLTQGLRRELEAPAETRNNAAGATIRWVVIDGGLPPGVDVADRESMQGWIQRSR